MEINDAFCYNLNTNLIVEWDKLWRNIGPLINPDWNKFLILEEMGDDLTDELC
jgi:hypothetical protein